MKIEFFENDHGLNFSMYPESVEELAQLMRFAKNAKAEKPNVFLTFDSDKDPEMNIWLTKIKKESQRNIIKPSHQ